MQGAKEVVVMKSFFEKKRTLSIFLAGVVAFSLVMLVVEFDASAARKAGGLCSDGALGADPLGGIGKIVCDENGNAVCVGKMLTGETVKEKTGEKCETEEKSESATGRNIMDFFYGSSG